MSHADIIVHDVSGDHTLQYMQCCQSLLIRTEEISQMDSNI